LIVTSRWNVFVIACLFASGLVAVSLAALHSPVNVSAQTSSSADSAKAGGVPAYTLSYNADGDLTPPLQYREWTYLTTGINMSYDAKPSDGMSMFDNVFVNPEAYRVFLATGTWPDKTVIALEHRQAASKGSINKSGNFQSGGVMGLELHVKDEARFPGKWAFFDVANETKATLIPSNASCYSCHVEHAAVDTTFVQFYPTLLPVANQKGTLSAAYRKEAVPTK
jgi:hypothetical protein